MQRQRFPAAASILSSEHLTERVLRRYELKEPVRCRFFRLGVNDTFQVHAGLTQYFLRVYRHGWRTRAQIAAELDMLVYLRSEGIPVSSPLERRDGGYLSRIDAHEGVRYAVLFTAAPGRGMKRDLRNCFSYGELAARIHVSLDRRPRDERRFDLDFLHLVHGPLLHLERVLGHRQADLEYLRTAGVGLAKEIEARLPTTTPAYGSCHGDHHGGNIHIDQDGLLTLFDFDCYGYGWRAYDIAVFLLGLSLRFGQSGTGKGKATRRWNAFLRGYESIRKLGAAEREAISLFVPVRHLWLMGLHAQGIDVWGYSLMQDTDFDRHLKFFRGWIERYKLQ